jgi:predicted nucleotidyltransferase
MADFTAELRRVPEVDEAWVFGSRAKGTHKPGSDVDLAIGGPRVDFAVVSRLRYRLNEETQLPYSFDVVDRSTIQSQELRDHIERVGLLVYKKGDPEGSPTESND